MNIFPSIFQQQLRLSFIFILMTLPMWAQAQVTGQAFLQGQSNHENIEVLFLPISIAGVGDTVLTDAAGNFSASVTPGVYEIYFSKSGYNPQVYDSGIGQVLTGNEVLQPITLLDFFTKYISGNISGTLYADTLYIASGDLFVNSGNSLVLNPGTHLLFDGNFQLICDGEFDAIGTAMMPITISSNLPNPAPEDYKGIKIQGGTSTVNLEHVLVEYADDGIYADGPPNVFANNCLFRYNNYGLRLQGPTAGTVTNNEFFEHKDQSLFIFSNTSGAVNVSCNYFHGGTGGGVLGNQLSTNLTITNNRFDSLMDVYEGPVSVWTEAGDVLIEDNLILNSTSGVRVLMTDSLTSSVTIQNNLISGNLNGISLRAAAGGTVITMNTIINNSNYGILQFYPSGGNPKEVSYNLVANNGVDYTFYQLIGAGANILTNANGDSCDAYFNISDPGMFDPSISWYPSAGSGLINGGNPLAVLDADGSVRDIGARYDPGCPFLQGGIVANASAVLPGDTDTDSMANVWDFLAIGDHYGATGPARANASNSFTPQPALDWGVAQSNGADLKHVDCNGDGVINSDDSTAIMLNYQTIPTGQPSPAGGNGAPLYFNMPAQAANPSDTVVIPIHLGVVDTPAVGMYGMALSITYDTMMVEPGSVWLDFSDSWIGELDSNMIAIQKDHFLHGKIDLAFTRTNQMNVDGYGKIAELIIVIDEDISKRFLPIEFNFVDIQSQGHDGSVVTVGSLGGTLTGEVEDSATTSIFTGFIEQEMLVFPNPAVNTLSLQMSENDWIEKVEIIRLDGAVVYQKEINQLREARLDITDVPEGMFILHAMTQEGHAYQTIRIAH